MAHRAPLLGSRRFAHSNEGMDESSIRSIRVREQQLSRGEYSVIQRVCKLGGLRLGYLALWR